MGFEFEGFGDVVLKGFDRPVRAPHPVSIDPRASNLHPPGVATCEGAGGEGQRPHSTRPPTESRSFQRKSYSSACVPGFGPEGYL